MSIDLGTLASSRGQLALDMAPHLAPGAMVSEGASLALDLERLSLGATLSLDLEPLLAPWASFGY